MALSSTEDLVKKVEEYLNELNDGTSGFRSQVVDFVDRAHKAIVAGGAELNEDGNRPVVFSWAKAKFPKTLILQPKETGTITATEDSTSITFGGAPSQNLQDWYIEIDDAQPIYRISAHTGTSTAATLDSAFVNANIAGADYTAFKLVYDLGTDVLLPAGPLRSFTRNSGSDRRIDIVSEYSLLKRFPLTDAKEDFPQIAGVMKFDSGTLTLQLSHYPKEKERIELPYIAIPSTLSVGGNDPILPERHRLLIADLAAGYMASQLDDDRASFFFNRAKDQFKALVRDERVITEGSNDNYGRIYPDENDHAFDGKFLTTASGDRIGAWD